MKYSVDITFKTRMSFFSKQAAHWLGHGGGKRASLVCSSLRMTASSVQYKGQMMPSLAAKPIPQTPSSVMLMAADAP